MIPLPTFDTVSTDRYVAPADEVSALREQNMLLLRYISRQDTLIQEIRDRNISLETTVSALRVLVADLNRRNIALEDRLDQQAIEMRRIITSISTNNRGDNEMSLIKIVSYISSAVSVVSMGKSLIGGMSSANFTRLPPSQIPAYHMLDVTSYIDSVTGVV